MGRQKCDYFQTGEYIYIANEWININVSYMFNNPCWHLYTQNSNFLDLGFTKKRMTILVYIYLTETIMIIPPIGKVVFVIIKVINASV